MSNIQSLPRLNAIPPFVSPVIPRFASTVIPRLVGGTYRGMVLDGVARTSRGMTGVAGMTATSDRRPQEGWM